MREKTLIPLIVGATIAIIVCASVLVPVINDQEEQINTTYSNNVGNHNLLKFEETAGDHTLSYVKGETYYTVDGVTFPITTAGDFVVIADTVSVFIQNSSGTNATLVNTALGTRISGNYAINATISNGTISGTVGTQSFSSACNGLFIAKQDGDYFTTSGTTQNLYVNDSKQIATVYNHVSFRDGVAKYDGNDATLVAPLTSVKDDVYLLDSSKVKVNDGSNHTANVFVAPVEVIGTNAIQQKVVDLVGITPILVMVAILSAIAIAVLKREQ